MKLLKQVIISIIVSLFILNISVYSENVNHIMISHKTEPNDAFVNRILAIYNQLQKCDNGILGIINNDTVWKYEGVFNTVPFAGTYFGKKGVKKFFKSFFNTVSNPRAELRYYLRQGNIIHLHWTEEGIIKSTGKKYVMETVQRWEFNDKGKLVKLRWYNDTYALYQAFQPHTDPRLSLAQHPADYNIYGDGPVAALPVIQNYYTQFTEGNLAAIINGLAPNFVLILAGPEGLTKIAGTWVGPQGMAQFLNVLVTNERYNSFQATTFTADKCRVDVEFEEEIVVIETAKIVTCAGLHSFVVNSNGQMAKLRSYNDTYSVAWGYTN